MVKRSFYFHRGSYTGEGNIASGAGRAMLLSGWARWHVWWRACEAGVLQSMLSQGIGAVRWGPSFEFHVVVRTAHVAEAAARVARERWSTGHCCDRWSPHLRSSLWGKRVRGQLGLVPCARMSWKPGGWFCSTNETFCLLTSVKNDSSLITSQRDSESRVRVQCFLAGHLT